MENKMCLEKYFDEITIDKIKYELDNYSDHCYFDEKINKIIYDSAEAALHSYCDMQVEEMGKYKWIKSEKAHEDLGEPCTQEWVAQYSETFRLYWVRTHTFVK